MAIEAWDESPVRLKQHLLELEARIVAGEEALKELAQRMMGGMAEAMKDPEPVVPPPPSPTPEAPRAWIGGAITGPVEDVASPSPSAPEAPRDPDPGAILA